MKTLTIAEIIALVFGILVLIAFIVYLLLNERKKVYEWLIYAVTQAEKELGKGTGQVKLRLVFDWFCEKFPIMSTAVPFCIFSKWVDTALLVMRKWLETNSKVEGYVNGN